MNQLDEIDSQIAFLRDLLTEERPRTNPAIKRCVAAMSEKNKGAMSKDADKATSRAFAICTANFNKHPDKKKGAAQRKGYSDRVDQFEKDLKRAKKARRLKKMKSGG